MSRFNVSGAWEDSGTTTMEIDALDADEACRVFREAFEQDLPVWVTSIAEMKEEADSSQLGTVWVNNAGIFGAQSKDPEAEFIRISDWTHPIQYFVGRNGSGKSKTAKAIAAATNSRLLAADRLVGLMNVDNYGWGLVPASYKGVPLGNEERFQILEMSRSSGLATSDLFTLREEPDVLLRVAAFMRRVLGRTIELRETAGYLDPYVRIGSVEYSLLRDEGHGLRELVVLLTATYRGDWSILLVDEPELHLHPSMTRLWLGELNNECERTGRRAIVVTHEPTFLRPKSAEDLGAIWVFSADNRPQRLIDFVLPQQRDRVGASLAQNQRLVSEIVFSPRPVLLEGVTDVAAVSTALTRISSPEVVAQTDLVDCGGVGGVALWLEICTKLGLDVRAICDLDALFSLEMQRAIDALPGMENGIVQEFVEDPGRISTVLRPLINKADEDGIDTTPAARGAWLGALPEGHSAEALRKARLLRLLSDHGVWAHPQGDLEDVLKLESKGVSQARQAASVKCELDSAAQWAAYELDLNGDVKELLGVAIERVAHSIMEAVRENPGVCFDSPVGRSSQSDARLVDVVPLGEDEYRLEVKTPIEYAGWWLEFSRDTPASDLNLRPPA